MKQIELNGKKVLVGPGLSPNAKVFVSVDMTNSQCLNYSDCGHLGSKSLPPGNYQLLGRAGELTEEQCKGLVEPDGDAFKCYAVEGDSWHNPVESWQSFCRANNIQPNKLILTTK